MQTIFGEEEDSTGNTLAYSEENVCNLSGIGEKNINKQLYACDERHFFRRENRFRSHTHTHAHTKVSLINMKLELRKK